MKHSIEHLLQQAITSLQQQGLIPQDVQCVIKIDHVKDEVHGDYATNLALMLAKPCRQAPQKLAELIIKALPLHPDVKKVEIGGAGFINFFMHDHAHSKIINEVLTQGQDFGCSSLGKGQKIVLEFVSANPTGPLHVGHGRSAAFGASLAKVLKAAGFELSSEYYVNDAGRQMNILAVSVWLRYLEHAKEPVLFPANAYKGDYVQQIAETIWQEQGRQFVHSWPTVIADLPLDEPEGGDKELYIDALIAKAIGLLGKEGFACFHQHALTTVLDDIKNDLEAFGVCFDNWFSEQSLFEDGSIKKGIQALQKGGHTFEHEGALWFKATEFGDEKDRVLVRANGQTTYFASDVAYHWNKYERGYDRVIDILALITTDI